MGYSIHQSRADVWELAARQHGVITRRQLLDLGFSAQAIKRRMSNGRLHRIRPGIYAVGRPQVTQQGVWMAAVLSCGPRAVLSHESAAALWRIHQSKSSPIHVSVRDEADRRRPGLVIHRRPGMDAADVVRCQGIPVTSPICTLIDLAVRLEPRTIEASVNEADKLGLTDPERLRAALTQQVGRPGVRKLRELLDRRTFTLTDSELERRLLRIVRETSLGKPLTGQIVCGFKVDFFWPDLGLIVETDGLRYHRTPAQQARDRLRDQVHTVAGLTTLRFTHAQVAFEPGYVQSTLEAMARRLRP